MSADTAWRMRSVARSAYWNSEEIAGELARARMAWRTANRNHAEAGAGFPSREGLREVVAALAAALFPLRLGSGFLLRAESEHAFVVERLETALAQLVDQVRLELGYATPEAPEAVHQAGASLLVGAFARELPRLRRLLDQDVEAAYSGDPAARSVDEVLLCYPSLLAVIHYRLAHELFRLGAPIVARIIAELAHSETGIDIHPGATIGSRFFIDHGSGVVIGETAVIGDRVRLYQAVTLGARSFPADANGMLTKGLPRHPIVEDDVVIYAGATILGRVTIGRGSVIGGNVWLTESVPPGSAVHQACAELEPANPDHLPTGHVVSPAADPASPDRSR
jgi:serine O-acetyltransferase